MERTVEVATGESVTFSYELAGLGSRFFAVFIDFAIQIAVALAAALLFLWIGTANVRSDIKFHDVSKVGQAIVVAIASLLAFLLFFGYFIFFEWRFEGRTPGKRLLGIRVVRDGGFPIDFTSAVVRNVIRILEFGLGFYAISAISTLVSIRNRRIGDFAAGTIVVRDHAYERTRAFLPGQRGDAHDVLVRDLGEAERDLVRRYVARRSSLGREARATVAARIAAVVRPKLRATFEHLGDDDLLVHVAETALGELP